MIRAERGDAGSDQSSSPAAESAIADLIALWRVDSRRGVSQIYRRYSRRVLEIVSARGRSILKGALDPADVVQSVFSRLLGVVPPGRIAGERDLLGYLARAAENEIRDQQRYFSRQRRSRAAEQSLDALEDGCGDLRSATPTPSEVAMGREAHQRFVAALAALPQAQREAYVEARLIGCNSEEGARRLGLPSAAAFRQALARAVAKLTLATAGSPEVPAERSAKVTRDAS